MKEAIVLFNSRKELEAVLKDRTILQIRIGVEKYCVTRLGLEVFLFETTCPHFDYPLVEAHVNAFAEVVCPWHTYRFRLGNGTESQGRCRSLKVISAFWGEQGELKVTV